MTPSRPPVHSWGDPEPVTSPIAMALVLSSSGISNKIRGETKVLQLQGQAYYPALHIIVNWGYLSVAECHIKSDKDPFFTLLAGLQMHNIIKGTVYNFP